MKLKGILSFVASALLCAATFTSCVNKDVDDPPANGSDPAITANKTIAQIKTLYVTGQVTTITGDYTFKGVVVGDDRSGNIYKNIIIQDSTGGISIAIDESNFYTSFEVGRTVFVKCKGMVIGDYHNLIQMGGYIDNSSGSSAVGRIPASLVGQHIFGGQWNQPTPIKIASNFLSLDNVTDQNKLVRLDGVHFKSTFACTPWADVINQASIGSTLIDAYGNTMTVYTSNYANFATNLIPSDTGSITGIFQIYGSGSSAKQFVVRDLSDVQIGSSHCIPPVPVVPVGTGALMSIGSVRPLYTGAGTTFVSGTKIRGVVISDKSTSQITARNIVLQDGSSGIVVRFNANNTFSLNDSIEIDLSGDSLTTFGGVLQINSVPNASATFLGTGSVTPRVVTISQINAAGTSWESTLVKILNVTSLTGGTAGTYKGTVTIGDGTATMSLYTPTGATFSGSTYPASSLGITGYLNTFSSAPELQIRNLGDVQ